MVPVEGFGYGKVWYRWRVFYNHSSLPLPYDDAGREKWRTSAGLPKWKSNSLYTELAGRKVLTFYPVSHELMPPDPAWGDLNLNVKSKHK